MTSKLLTKYKDHLQTAATLIGVITVVLYVFGYVAERVHWNSLGIIEVPANHIEFLYRGGNVAISSLASIALYLLSTLLSLDAKALLLVVLLTLIILTNLFAPGRVIALGKVKFSLPRDSLLATFVLLIGLSVWELSAFPNSRTDTLFQSPTVLETEHAVSFFESFMGVLFLWLVFCGTTYRARHLQTEKPVQDAGDDRKDDTGQQAVAIVISGQEVWLNAWAQGLGTETPAGETPRSVPSRLVRFLSGVGLIIALVLLLAMPLAYGSFRFPYQYPVVEIVLTEDAPVRLKSEFGQQVRVALLYETEKDLVTYRKSPAPMIFKVRKDIVSGVVVLKNANILTTDPAQ